MGSCFARPRTGIVSLRLEDRDEWEEFQRLLKEDLNDPAAGWKIKKDWAANYKNDYKIRISLKPDTTTGNPNYILRADVKFRVVTAQAHLDCLVTPDNLPGLQELETVETLPDGYIKYCRVKAPCLAARDHCWKYTIDHREDGSIFCCLRTATHPKCPLKAGVIRAYYYNATLITMSADEPRVMCFTEFIQQDLKGGLPVCLMNAALPAGTVAANDNEMKTFKKKGLFKP
ncbi:unnamed protein product [Polarella glacialis]|uniref:START domain-containing protein n=1 Tax=Polarella glacialis TaxID=89957 RepID=A0A813KIZ6_POLGL|nr:unnamed protein product [Polarella glacialis]CAE8705710.1 unnamed protein product [Polarella glacialis]